jgi:hypothetical protein
MFCHDVLLGLPGRRARGAPALSRARADKPRGDAGRPEARAARVKFLPSFRNFPPAPADRLARCRSALRQARRAQSADTARQHFQLVPAITRARASNRISSPHTAKMAFDAARDAKELRDAMKGQRKSFLPSLASQESCIWPDCAPTAQPPLLLPQAWARTRMSSSGSSPSAQPPRSRLANGGVNGVLPREGVRGAPPARAGANWMFRLDAWRPRGPRTAARRSGARLTRRCPRPQAIRAAFKQEYGKDLIETVRSEVGGILESALAALLYTPSECAARAGTLPPAPAASHAMAAPARR